MDVLVEYRDQAGSEDIIDKVNDFAGKKLNAENEKPNAVDVKANAMNEEDQEYSNPIEMIEKEMAHFLESVLWTMTNPRM